jgi:hypothetical protein
MTANYVNGQDTLAFVNQNGITGTWTPASGVLALSGSSSVANYQLALRSITYNNSSDTPNTLVRTVTFVVNDGALASNTASRAITITAVNDAPVVTATGGSMAYTENGTSLVDSLITATDVDSANLSSATVTMTANYVNGQDTLAFVNQNGITGTWTPASGVLALSGSSSVANYQTALRSITYNNSSDNPTTTTRTVTFKVNDGALASNTASRTITITAVNDAPVVAAATGGMAYTENGTTALDSVITVVDADSASMSSATVTITNKVVAEDILGFINQNGITGVWTGASGVLALSGSSSVANYQTALRSITYNNSSENPTTPARNITVVVSDGAASSAAVTRTVTLTAVNDAPFNGVPVTQTAPKNGSRVFSSANGNLISITDVDAGASIVQVQLVATTGRFWLSGLAGLTFSVGDGTNDPAMTFTGTITDINAALAGLRFDPTNGFTGTASLQIITSDQGFTGSGGTKTDNDTINITVS